LVGIPLRIWIVRDAAALRLIAWLHTRGLPITRRVCAAITRPAARRVTGLPAAERRASVLAVE
jgi:hypothetical protein